MSVPTKATLLRELAEATTRVIECRRRIEAESLALEHYESQEAATRYDLLRYYDWTGPEEEEDEEAGYYRELNRGYAQDR